MGAEGYMGRVPRGSLSPTRSKSESRLADPQVSPHVRHRRAPFSRSSKAIRSSEYLERLMRSSSPLSRAGVLSQLPRVFGDTDRLAGNGPMIVNKLGGTIEFFGTAKSPLTYIEEYERRLSGA